MAEAKDETATPKSATSTTKRAAKPRAKATTAKTAAKPETKTATETSTSTAAGSAARQSQSAKPEAEKPVQSTQNADQSDNRISVTIPLDGPVVGVAVKAATLPLTAAKKVAQNRNGIPAYVAVGGLAVIGAVEWPVAAVGGLGLAALRRWGPLKPADKDSDKNA